MHSRVYSFLSIVLLLAACAQPGGIRRARPASVGMSAAHLALIDSAVNASIGQGDIPGAVVGVVRYGSLVYEKAFGYKSVYPEKDTMTVQTMFDLASVSKCVGTTLSFMQLVEQGKVRLIDKVSCYIPEFQPWEDPETGEKVDITVQNLLTHSSGIDAYLADVPAYVERYGAGSPDSLMHYIAVEAGRHFRPGSDRLYSCLNFITLQHILERVSGERLCDYAQKHVFDVLGLKHTTYMPLALEGDAFFGANLKADAPEFSAAFPATSETDALVSDVAPSEVMQDGSVLRGQVHDPIARIINLGNSGNAGVFSNVEDLAVICAALLNGGAFNGHRILGPQTVRKMFEEPSTDDPKVARALGWDTYYTGPYTSGDIFALQNLRGHTGYTGTSILLDPDTQTAVILLAHRVHPTDDGSVARLRSVVATIVAASIGR